MSETWIPIDMNVLFLVKRLVQKQPSYRCNHFGICNNVFDALLGAYELCLKDLAHLRSLQGFAAQCAQSLGMLHQYLIAATVFHEVAGIY